jgi:hypothetical protein
MFEGISLQRRVTQTIGSGGRKHALAIDAPRHGPFLGYSAAEH